MRPAEKCTLSRRIVLMSVVIGLVLNNTVARRGVEIGSASIGSSFPRFGGGSAAVAIKGGESLKEAARVLADSAIRSVSFAFRSWLDNFVDFLSVDPRLG